MNRYSRSLSSRPHAISAWLEEVAILAGFGTTFLIDEAHAAVLGYGINPRSGCKVLIIEFGQDGLEVRIVAIGEENPNPADTTFTGFGQGRE